MALFLSMYFDMIKACITGLWAYLWILWLFLVFVIVYVLRGPLKLIENVSYGMLFYIVYLLSLKKICKCFFFSMLCLG